MISKRVSLITSFFMAVILALLAPITEGGETKRAQLSVYSPHIQTGSPEDDVDGFRLSLLYGESSKVTGLDGGLVNRAVRSVHGAQFGLVNAVGDGESEALQLGCINLSDGKYHGHQVGPANYAESLQGDQLGLLSGSRHSKGDQVGLLFSWSHRSEGALWGFLTVSGESASQVGAINMASRATHNQFGFLNYASRVEGLQFGVLNIASEVSRGMQFGLLNIIAHGSSIPVLPIFNMTW